MHPKPYFFAVIFATFALWLSGCGNGDGDAGLQFVTIGTGGVTGVYYPVGGALASMANEAEGLNIRASAESTAGSVFNINAVLTGDMDFGIAQADRQYQAYHGLEEWESQGPREDLRAVASLYTELVTLLAAEDADIETLEDLRGKRVNIGNPGSGSRVNATDVLAAAGLDPEQDVDSAAISSSESAKLMQDDQIAAYFFTVGHPAGSFMEATSGRRTTRFVPITGMETLIEAAPYYTEAKIPMALYPSAGNEEDVPTIGVTTSLITSSAVDEELVYQFTKLLVENLDTFKQQHAALAELTPESLASGGPIPRHPGAERYYEEAGLLPLPDAASS